MVPEINYPNTKTQRALNFE
jgi:hypothetical protein